MDEQIIKNIIDKYNDYSFQTDSDLRDFCEKYGCSFNDALLVISQHLADIDNDSCKNCKHVCVKYFGGQGYPCSSCSRYVTLSDYYEECMCDGCLERRGE